MKNSHNWINTALIVLVGILVLVGSNQSGTGETSGVGSGTRFPNGLSVDTTKPSAGQIRGATFLATGAVTLQSTLGVTGKVTHTNSVAAYNGVDVAYGRDTTITSASTTACSITGSTSTSTLEYLIFALQSATNSALHVELGYGAAAGATTTSLGIDQIAIGNGGGTVSATTSNGIPIIIPPNQVLNVIVKDLTYLEDLAGYSNLDFACISRTSDLD